jgi:hypothetical protein
MSLGVNVGDGCATSGAANSIAHTAYENIRSFHRRQTARGRLTILMIVSILCDAVVNRLNQIDIEIFAYYDAPRFLKEHSDAQSRRKVQPPVQLSVARGTGARRPPVARDSLDDRSGSARAFATI